MTADALAKILDRHKEVDSWWGLRCPTCRYLARLNHHDLPHIHNGHHVVPEEVYCGPLDLPTHRRHAWHLENYLEEHDWLWARKYDHTEMQNYTQVTKHRRPGEPRIESIHTDHMTALRTAIQLSQPPCPPCLRGESSSPSPKPQRPRRKS